MLLYMGLGLLNYFYEKYEQNYNLYLLEANELYYYLHFVCHLGGTVVVVGLMVVVGAGKLACGGVVSLSEKK